MTEYLGLAIKAGVVIDAIILDADANHRSGFIQSYTSSGKADSVVVFPDASAPGLPGRGWTTTDGVNFAPPPSVGQPPVVPVNPNAATNVQLVATARAALLSKSASDTDKLVAATFLNSLGLTYV